MSLRSSFWQQNLLYVLLSTFCGCYLWSVFVLHQRARERQQHTQLEKKVSTFCASVLPALDWKATLDTVPARPHSFWTADVADGRGENHLRLRWNAVTGELVSASSPASERGDSWLQTAPPSSPWEAQRRASELLLRLGERTWAVNARWTVAPHSPHENWTLFARRASQQAVLKLDAAHGAFRFFRVWPVRDATAPIDAAPANDMAAE